MMQTETVAYTKMLKMWKESKLDFPRFIIKFCGEDNLNYEEFIKFKVFCLRLFNKKHLVDNSELFINALENYANSYNNKDSYKHLYNTGLQLNISDGNIKTCLARDLCDLERLLLLVGLQTDEIGYKDLRYEYKMILMYLSEYFTNNKLDAQL